MLFQQLLLVEILPIFFTIKLGQYFLVKLKSGNGHGDIYSSYPRTLSRIHATNVVGRGLESSTPTSAYIKDTKTWS